VFHQKYKHLTNTEWDEKELLGPMVQSPSGKTCSFLLDQCETIHVESLHTQLEKKRSEYPRLAIWWLVSIPKGSYQSTFPT
jgi:hypothetical protein